MPRSRYYRVQQGEEQGPYWLRAIVAIDELTNVAIYDGNPHETISQHCGWDHGTKRATWLVNVTYRLLDYFFPGHCEEAIAGVVRPAVWTG
jgi:hypothetical protein